ncbi:DUF6083 domain-containing protein [Streptomyces sp. NPDC019937]|uniref:DUF6083 domain-containing protein n=1 Tax=Streptomyces sp. NPDC019937 TaxID=3154787 RepID=UPI0033D2947D
MHSSPPFRRYGDGSPIISRRSRPLCVAPDSPSRLLRCAQRSRCRECGNPVEWYHRVDDRSVRLHPHELPVADVPVGYHWHVSSGLAHHAGDGSPWCRLAHGVVCPAHAADAANAPELTRLRRVLAVNTRRLTEAGVFTPNAPTRATQQPDDACRPARPVVQLLYVRYLAARPVDEIQCVAQTLRRDRCTHTVLTSDRLAGLWKLVPATSARGQLAVSADVMALYDLSFLPYAEQLRWRRQLPSARGRADRSGPGPDRAGTLRSAHPPRARAPSSSHSHSSATRWRPSAEAPQR